MPNRPLVMPQVQQTSVDPVGILENVARLQVTQTALQKARQDSEEQQAIQQLAQQYPDNPDEFVKALSTRFPERAAKFSGDLWESRKQEALAHKAQVDASIGRTEVGLQMLQAARKNPALYPAVREWITKASPELGQRMAPEYNEQEVDGWLSAGMKANDFNKAQSEAADRLAKGDAQTSVLRMFAGASNSQMWQQAQEMWTRSGMKSYLGLVAPEWSPEAQQSARTALEGAAKTGAAASPEQQLIAAFEAEKGRKPTSKELIALHGAWGKSDDRPISINMPRPMTQTAEAGLITKLSGQWTKATQSQKEINRQVTIMDKGLAAGRRGDLPQANEAVLQTFLKILDPDSVVREGEFQRLREGASLTTRVETAFQRLNQGGFLPMSELEKYAALAKEVQASTSRVVGPVRERIGKTADRYKIPRDLVLDESVDVGAAPPPPPPPGGYKVDQVVTVKGKKVKITKVLPNNQFEGVPVP